MFKLISLVCLVLTLFNITIGSVDSTILNNTYFWFSMIIISDLILDRYLARTINTIRRIEFKLKGKK